MAQPEMQQGRTCQETEASRVPASRSRPGQTSWGPCTAAAKEPAARCLQAGGASTLCLPQSKGRAETSSCRTWVKVLFVYTFWFLGCFSVSVKK